MSEIFEWDETKNQSNIEKHSVSFEYAKQAFYVPNRLTLYDDMHSENEERFFCIGKTEDGILTVQFVIRDNAIRIIGAGFWRKGKQRYEKR
jgi:uncharacterized DUF497 family protein